MSDAAVSTPTQTPAGVAIEIDLNKPTDLSKMTAGTITNDGGTPGTPADAGATKSFIDTLPEEYRTKEWAMNLNKRLSTDPNLNPLHELVKEHDNQQSLIGRKADGLKVPGEGATAEEWKAFYNSIGVPETPDKYEYTAPGEVPEHLKEYFSPDEGLLSAMKEAAMRAGVRPEGFKLMAEALDKYTLDVLEKQHSEMDATLTKLETDFKQKYGEKSNQVLGSWEKSLATSLGTERAGILEQLDPRVKVVLAEHFHSFASKYISEDSLSLDVPNSGSAMTKAEYEHRYEEGFGKVVAAKKNHGEGSAEHQAAKAELQKLKEIGAEVKKYW